MIEKYLLFMIVVLILGIIGNLIIIATSSEKELKEERKRMGIE